MFPASTKGGGQLFAFPDVCKVPAPPAPPIPTPFPNIGMLNMAKGATCSQKQGAGQWAGYQLPDGSIFLMIHFSDLARSNTCFSQTIRLGNGGFVDSGGGNWRRVQ